MEFGTRGAPQNVSMLLLIKNRFVDFNRALHFMFYGFLTFAGAESMSTMSFR